MSAQYYDLKTLKARVERLIEVQGPDAPVAYWIYTNEDVLTFDDEMQEQYYPIETCEDVLSSVQDVDYIHEQIAECIEDELRYLRKTKGLTPM